MDLNKFQKICGNTVKSIDEKKGTKRNPQFSFTQFIEEVGELAKAINRPKLRHKPLDKENLEEEFADVFLQFAILANIYNVDIEKVTKEKIEILKEKFNLKKN